MLKKVISIICVVALSVCVPLPIFAEDAAYALNETFDGIFTPYETNTNLILGGSVTSVINYRDKNSNKSVNTIETDNIKTNYFKQSLRPDSSKDNWRGVYFDVTSPSEAEYQLLEFNFKMSKSSSGLWVQVCDDSSSAGNNTGSRAVIFSISKNTLVLRHKNSIYKSLKLSDYGLPEDLTKTESWHNIKVIMNTKRSTYDVMMNGILIAADVSAGQEQAATGHKVQRIYFSAQGVADGNYVGLDDIQVSDMTESEANDLTEEGFDALLKDSVICSDELKLPCAGILGANITDGAAKITYSSDNTDNVSITDTHYTSTAGETCINFSGMPASEADDINFNLTVNIDRGGDDGARQLTYPLTLAYKSEARKAQLDARLLSLSDFIDCVYGDTSPTIFNTKLNLPQEGSNGSAISWISSNEDIIDSEGNVTKGAVDTIVTLTADFGYGVTKDFNLFVTASVEKKLHEDAAATVLPKEAKTSFELPLTGAKHGSAITWSAESEDRFAIIIRGGKAIVTRPEYGQEDSIVKLIAVYTLSGESAKYEYEITVPALDKKDDDDEEPIYRINQTFDGKYEPDPTNPNIITGNSILSYYNYRNGRANASRNTIESDSVKTNFFKQTLLSNSESSNWRGVYFDLDTTPRSEYQLFEFSFKLGEKSSGLWVQVCDDSAKETGNNTGSKFVMFSIAKTKIYLRDSSTSFKNIELADYDIDDLTKYGRWHNVKVIMDTERFVYDLLIDDKLIAADVISAGDAQTLKESNFLVKRLYFSAQGNAEGNYICLDDIMVSDISAKKANELVKIGFDTLFSSREIYSGNINLPFAGMNGYYPTINGDAKIAYASDNSENVIITDTHYNNGAGESKLDFVNMPSSDSDADVPFKLFIRVERPKAEGGSAVSAFEYDFRLSYMTDAKRTALDASLLTYSDITNENPKQIVSNLTLPDKGKNGSSISWECDVDGVIAKDGSVTRQDEDISLTLTAVFVSGSARTSVDFPLIIKRSSKGEIKEDEAASGIGDLGDITDDFTLPLKGSVNGSSITWSSNSAKIFIKNGKALVTRPEYSDGDVPVILTAKYVLDFETVVFTYNLTVKRQLSDEETVRAAYDSLDFSDLSTESIDSVTRNLSLLTVLENGVTCEWASDNEAVIKPDGTVLCPLNASGNSRVRLSATLKKGSVSLEKIFDVSVASFRDEEDVLNRAKEMLTFNLLSDESIDAVTSDLTLPQTGYYGSKISWVSESPDMIFISGTTGRVIRPKFGEAERSVNLKAEITYGNAKTEKLFLIKVLQDTGYEVVFSSDFDQDGSIIGSTVIVDGIGKARLENTDRGKHEVAYDPTNRENKVACFTRNAGVSTSCTVSYLTNFGSQNFATDELTVKTKIYIPSDVKHELWYYLCAYDAVSGSMNPTVLVEFAADGTMRFNYVLSGTQLKLIPIDFKYAHDTWYELEIRGNTYSGKYNVYINGMKISDNVYIDGDENQPFDTSEGLPFYDSQTELPSNFYAIRLRHEGAAEQEASRIYFDDISVERRVQNEQNVDEALKEFRMKFLSQNSIASVYKDISFPNLSVKGVSVEYISGDENIVTNSGKVIFKNYPQKVTMLVKFTGIGGTSVYESYELNILSADDPIFESQMTDAQRVEADFEDIIKNIKSTYNLSNITADIKLPEKTKNGSAVKYISSDTSVLSETGIVKRDKSDKKVTLTVTVSYGTERKSEDIIFTVKKDVSNTQLSSGGGGGGGGSRYSGVSEPTPTVTPDTTQLPNPTENPDLTEAPVPTRLPEKKDGFKDVKDGFWAHDEIYELREAGIVSGTDNENFNPDACVKREEFIKMLVLAAGMEDASGESGFVDVSPDEWYYAYVGAAYHAGMVSGYPDGRFGVGDNITRQDMAVIIYNTVKPDDADEDAVFADDDQIAQYAKNAVYALRASGIVTGRDDNMFAPCSDVTRAEAAVIIYRIMGDINET